MKGVLYVVSTPIGNLEDITLRALRVLKEADLIAAEDTRHTLKLLNHFGIKKPLISYWSAKEKARAEEITGKLKEGLSVALVTDAGTPGISDPGAVLIRKAIEEGVEAVSVPGPSASIAALSISGLPADEFTFIGFLPPKKNERVKKLRELALETRTLVLYEAPHRVIDTLLDMEEVMGGQRRIAVVREITKIHEEALRGDISGVLDILESRPVVGEYVLVVEGGKPGSGISMEEAAGRVKGLMEQGKGRKEAAAEVAGEYGLSKKELYDRSLK